MIDIVTIRTPQFKGKSIDRWHVQKGTISFDPKDRELRHGVLSYCTFIPLNTDNGDHRVYFYSEQDLDEATI